MSCNRKCYWATQKAPHLDLKHQYQVPILYGKWRCQSTYQDCNSYYKSCMWGKEFGGMALCVEPKLWTQYVQSWITGCPHHLDYAMIAHMNPLNNHTLWYWRSSLGTRVQRCFQLFDKIPVVIASSVGRKERIWQIIESGRLLILSTAASSSWESSTFRRFEFDRVADPTINVYVRIMWLND